MLTHLCAIYNTVWSAGMFVIRHILFFAAILAGAIIGTVATLGALTIPFLPPILGGILLKRSFKKDPTSPERGKLYATYGIWCITYLSLFCCLFLSIPGNPFKESGIILSLANMPLIPKDLLSFFFTINTVSTFGALSIGVLFHDAYPSITRSYQYHLNRSRKLTT